MKRFVICIIMVFLLISSLSVSANTSFADVKETDWYYETVTEMAERGLFAGKGNNLFCPHDKMTKAEFIAVVVRSLFPNEDLTPKQGEKWWMPSYNIALETGLITENEITSSGSGTFLYGTTVTRVSDLEQPIQRQMMAMISVRALEILGETDVKAYNEDYIPDYSDVGIYYRYYVCKAYGAGIIVGDENGNFNPESTLTRAEASTVLYRIIEKSARIKVDFNSPVVDTLQESITIYEGQYRNNRNAKEGDTFVKADGTQIILKI